MPTKGSVHGKSAEQMRSLAAARAQIHSKTSENVHTSASAELANVQKLLSIAEEKLKQAEEKCIVLASELSAEQKKSANLTKALADEKQHSDDLYQQLRVKRRAWQRGLRRKNVLEAQINLLQNAGSLQSDELRNIKSNASKAIEKLLKMEKENASLRSELSVCLERCKSEAKQAQIKAYAISQKLKHTKRLAAQLQRSNTKNARFCSKCKGQNHSGKKCSPPS